MAQNLKTGDNVMIIAGDHKGQTAKIVKMDRKNHKAMLDGIGVINRTVKPSRLYPRGGKKTVHVGIDLSNLKKVEGK